MSPLLCVMQTRSGAHWPTRAETTNLSWHRWRSQFLWSCRPYSIVFISKQRMISFIGESTYPTCGIWTPTLLIGRHKNFTGHTKTSGMELVLLMMSSLLSLPICCAFSWYLTNHIGSWRRSSEEVDCFTNRPMSTLGRIDVYVWHTSILCMLSM